MVFSQSHFPRAQQGAVLVVSLLLLLVMTILALSASQSTRMQERMAGNARDADMAFEASEAGVRDAENYLTGLATRPDGCSSAPCTVYQKDVLAADLANQPVTWWYSASPVNTTEYGVAGTKEISGVAQDPRYVIEEYAYVSDDLTTGHGPPTGRVFYRETSYGEGGTISAGAAVQATYTRRY